MEKVFFEANTGRKLCGILNSVDNRKIVILCHGSDSSKESLTYVNFAKRINDIGVSSFRMDFSGHGESEGIPEDYSIKNAVEEILSAINYLKERGFQKFALLGSSRGGTSVLRAAVNSSELSSLVLICPGSTKEDYPERKKLASKINVPVLIIHGDKDPFIPLHESEELIKVIPNAKLEIMSNGGHNFTEAKEHKKMLDLGTFFIQKNF